MSTPLQGKVAVVTGAGNGIGRASALRLAKDGADIGLLDLEKDAVEAVAAEIRALGRKALPINIDCTNAEAIAGAFARIKKELGPVHVLLNNVGQSARERTSEFVDADMKVLDFILDVNLKSCILCAHQVAGDMKARGAGKIVNITSESAVNGSLKTWEYSAAKAGVIGFTRSIARELAPYNVTVNAIGPGSTQTRAMDRMPQDLMDKVKAGIPMKRMGKPDDIANAVAFFAGDQADYVTGQTLLVNGGNWML